MSNRYLNMAEIAKHFDVSTRTISRWMKEGLPYVKKGVVRFKLDECVKWFENNSDKKGD